MKFGTLLMLYFIEDQEQNFVNTSRSIEQQSMSFPREKIREGERKKREGMGSSS